MPDDCAHEFESSAECACRAAVENVRRGRLTTLAGCPRFANEDPERENDERRRRSLRSVSRVEPGRDAAEATRGPHRRLRPERMLRRSAILVYGDSRL